MTSSQTASWWWHPFRHFTLWEAVGEIDWLHHVVRLIYGLIMWHGRPLSRYHRTLVKSLHFFWRSGTRRFYMMTSSNIFRVTGHLCGEFTGPGEFPTQRPVTRSFDVFFNLHLNKQLRKQWWGWWFETLSRPLWRHRNDLPVLNLCWI